MTRGGVRRHGARPGELPRLHGRARRRPTASAIGIVVLFCLGVLFIFAYLLKKEYWKDVK